MRQAEDKSDTESPSKEFSLNRPDHHYDHEAGEEYLALFEDKIDIESYADDGVVRPEDVRRIIYTTGATLVHATPEEADVRYRGDGYTVTAGVGNLDVVQEQISREITDEHAIRTEREMAPVDEDDHPDDDALVSHYTEYLRYSVMDAMRALDESGSQYPVGYPLVVLTDD